MLRKIFIGALVATGLLAATTLNPPVEAQIGIGRTTSELTLSGQLSIADGTVADPSIVFTSDDDGTGTGIYRIGANHVGVATNGALSTSFVGAGVRTVNGAGTGASYSFSSDADIGMYRVGANHLGFASRGALVFDLEDRNAAGAGANLATISATLGIMDGSDTVNGLSIELTSVDHTGVGNLIAASTIAAITGDAQARETGLDVLGGFDIGISSIGAIFDRQDFDEPVFEIQDDFTAKSLATTEVNLAMGHGGILFEYRNELTQTTSPVIFTATGGLDISGDDGATGDEGVEIYLGASQNTTTGYLVAQTDQLCFSANVTITLIAGTDQLVIGWRGNEAYQAGNVYTGYAEYAVIGVNNIDGSVFALSETATGPDTGSDDSETNFTNGSTKTLKVCIDGAGLTHHYLDGTIVAEDGGSPNDFAMTSGTVMNPFISYLDVASTAADPIINWWAITAN